MQTLRIENNDSRIRYGPPAVGWSLQVMADTEGVSVPVMTTGSTRFNSRMLILFRGTGFKFYAGGTGNITLGFDGEPLHGLSDVPQVPGGPPLLEFTNLEDTDHQLFVFSAGNIWIDHFDLESSTGQGFDTINTGPTAKSVPEAALVVEDTSTDIIYSPPEDWTYSHVEIYSGDRLAATTIPGTKLTYSFEGVGIWMFTDFSQGSGNRTISIDDGSPESISTEHETGQLFQRLAWQKTGLQPDVQHTITIEHTGNQGEGVTFDFFRILRSQEANALTSDSTSSDEVRPTSSLPPAKDQPVKSTLNVMAIAIGVSLGVIAMLILVAFLFCRLKRRKALNEQLLPMATPFPGVPTAKLEKTDQNYQPERPSMEAMEDSQRASKRPLVSPSAISPMFIGTTTNSHDGDSTFSDPSWQRTTFIRYDVPLRTNS